MKVIRAFRMQNLEKNDIFFNLDKAGFFKSSLV